MPNREVEVNTINLKHTSFPIKWGQKPLFVGKLKSSNLYMYLFKAAFHWHLDFYKKIQFNVYILLAFKLRKKRSKFRLFSSWTTTLSENYLQMNPRRPSSNMVYVCAGAMAADMGKGGSWSVLIPASERKMQPLHIPFHPALPQRTLEIGVCSQLPAKTWWRYANGKTLVNSSRTNIFSSQRRFLIKLNNWIAARF